MADFSRSVQRTQATTPTLSKKISNGNGFTAKTAYDDVFGGPPKFGVPTFSSRIDDYNEIFGNFHASRASSIPILDLPVVDERDVSIDVRSTKFDYSEVFGGFNGFDFAISYEDLLAEPKGTPKGGESSSEDVWTPAETGSASEGSSEDPVCSENNQPFLDEESHQSCNGTKQFNMSFHKTNQISKDDGISATTHIAQLNSVPAFTFVVEENIPLEKTEQGKPFSHETKVCESNVDFSVGTLEGNNLKEAISEQPACHTVTETSESNLKPQITSGGNGSFFDEEFLTVAEISLRTRPSHVPPPSRPPPNLTVKQGDSKRLAASRHRASENYISGRAVSEDSPPFFDVEVDASSSAAASAAAMKEAMEKAQARLKSAKESMDRKRDGLQNRKKLGLRDDLTSKERKEGETIHEARRQKEKARETFEREDNKVKYSAAMEVEVVPDIEVNGRLVNASKELVEQNHLEGSKSTQEFRKQKDGTTGEWKVQEEYYELVKMDRFRAASEAPKHERGERELMPTQKAHESEKAAVTLVFDRPDENYKILKTIEAAPACGQGIAGVGLEVTREACVHEEHQKKIKAFEEVHELEEYKKELNVVQQVCEQEENEKKIKVTPSGEEQVKNKMESCEWEEHEKRLKEALEWDEHEQKLIEIRRREEDEKTQKTAREREENLRRERVEREREENAKRLTEAREKEENEKRLKEVLELEEAVKRQKDAREREENEIRLKKARELEENEKRLNEARELEENEKRRKDALDRERIENERKLEEAHAREENEKRLNEAREREENEKRLNEAHEREENEKRLNEAREKEENEKRLHEAREREENEKRQKEAREREEIERVQQEARIKEEIERKQQEARKTEEIERRQQEAQEREDTEKKLKAAQEAFLQTNECIQKTSRKSSEIAESEEKLKSADEVCKQECAQLSCEPEDIGKMMETAKHTSGHKDNENKLKASEKLADEEDFNDMLQKEHVNRSALEHKESENKKKVASNAKLHDIEKNLGESEDTIGQEKTEKIHKTDQVAIELEANKINYQGAQGMQQLAENGKKLEAAHPSFAMEQKRDRLRVPHEVNINQDVEPVLKNFKEVLVMEEKVKEEKIQKERDQVKERLRKAEEDKEREREREKDRMAVERATREARERAFADVRERAERAAVERATAEARQRAMAEARERLEKASAEAREKSLAEKASAEAREKSLAEKVSAEARLRLERAAVERATAEARERAAEKAMADNAALGARGRAERTYSEKFSATSRDSGMRHCSSFNDLRDSQFQSSNSSSNSQRYPNSSNHGASHVTEKFHGVETETAQRCKARLERHQRTVERAAKALAEKNMRDLHTQKEQAERNRLADTLDADVKRWSSGKEGNLRALLSTLQYILGPDSGWQPIPLTEVITAVAVKKAYRKATLCVHPDKLQQRGATIHQKYVCEKVFDLLKEAWNKFNSEER